MTGVLSSSFGYLRWFNIRLDEMMNPTRLTCRVFCLWLLTTDSEYAILLHMKKKKESISYYDDFNCHPCLLKNHTTGLKNFYTVEVEYVVESTGKTILLTRRYGNFSVAYKRFLMEQRTEVPYGKKRKSVKINVTTYSDAKVVHNETMVSVDSPIYTVGTDNVKRELMYAY